MDIIKDYDIWTISTFNNGEHRADGILDEGLTRSYNELKTTVEIFENEEDYIARCNDLGIELISEEWI